MRSELKGNLDFLATEYNLHCTSNRLLHTHTSLVDVHCANTHHKTCNPIDAFSPFFAKLPFRHRLPKREIAILFFSAIVILFLHMKGKSNHTNVHLSCSYAACTVIASQDVIQLNLSCSGLQSETNVRSGNATEFFRFVIPVARRSTVAGACRRHWWSNAIAFYRLLSSFNTRDTHT